MLQRFIDLLGSRRLATTVMLSWVGLLVVWVIPFQIYGLPAPQIQHILYREPFFLIVYALLLVSTAGCIVPRIPLLWRRFSRTPAQVDRPRGVGQGAARTHSGYDGDTAQALLSKHRCSRMVTTDSWAWGVKHRWSVWGTLLLHLSIFFLIGAAVVSQDVSRTFTGRAVVAEGERFSGAESEYIEIDEGGSSPPSVAFTLVELSPDFYEDLLLFTRLEATIQADGERREMALSSPWVIGLDSLVALEDFGYAPEVSVQGEFSEAVSTTHKLKVFPAGTQDSFEVVADDVSYRVEIQVFGDYTDVNGVPAAASFNLSDPRLLLDVQRVLSTGAEQTVVEDALLAPGESLEFEGATLAVDQVRTYGVFRVTRTPAVVLFFIGLALATLGAAMRLVWPMTQFLIAADDGGTSVSVVRDVYGADEFVAERLAREWSRS